MKRIDATGAAGLQCRISGGDYGIMAEYRGVVAATERDLPVFVRLTKQGRALISWHGREYSVSLRHLEMEVRGFEHALYRYRRIRQAVINSAGILLEAPDVVGPPGPAHDEFADALGDNERGIVDLMTMVRSSEGQLSRAVQALSMASRRVIADWHKLRLRSKLN